MGSFARADARIRVSRDTAELDQREAPRLAGRMTWDHPSLTPAINHPWSFLGKSSSPMECLGLGGVQ